MSPPFDVVVYLDIHGFTCRPEEIGDVLGLKASKTVRIGDTIARSTRPSSENRWQMRVDGVSNNLSECVRPLLAAVVPVTERFSGLPDNAEIQILCVVYDRERQVSLMFDPDVVAAAAALGAALNIDYYDMTDA